MFDVWEKTPSVESPTANLKSKEKPKLLFSLQTYQEYIELLPPFCVNSLQELITWITNCVVVIETYSDVKVNSREFPHADIENIRHDYPARRSDDGIRFFCFYFAFVKRFPVSRYLWSAWKPSQATPKNSSRPTDFIFSFLNLIACLLIKRNLLTSCRHSWESWDTDRHAYITSNNHVFCWLVN